MIKRAGVPARAIALFVIVLGACVSTGLDDYIESGRYVEAVDVFEADSSLHSNEEALYLAGVAYAVPGSEARDLGRSRELLTRLLDLYPRTEHRREVVWLLSFTEREEALVAQLAEVSNVLEQLKAVDLGRTGNLAATGSSEFNRLFDEGRYGRAASVFEADSMLRSAEHALFRAAIAYSLPRSSVHNPVRARALFERLVRLYPDTPYRDEAAWFGELLDLEIGLRSRLRILEGELEQLKAIDLGTLSGGTVR